MGDPEGGDTESAEELSAKEAAIVDGSVGSDTDTSKLDTLEVSTKGLGDGQEQIRPYAVKKSTTFKPVSITKNFLAKAGTASTPPSQSGSEKGILHDM